MDTTKTTITPVVLFDINAKAPTDKERAIADEATAKASGFSPAAPVYAIGTPVIELGRENFKASRKEIDDMPRAPQALDDLAARVRKECRSDKLVKAVDLRMMPDGSITRGTNTLPLTERAFRGLCALTTPGGAGYLEKCPPALRAENVNHWLSAAEKDRELTLRARKTTSGPEIFAAVGPRYVPFDADRVCEELRRAVPADAACDLTYDGYKLRANVLFHSDVRPDKVVAGEIFKAGLRVWAADDGTSSIKVSAQIWRNLCLNLIVVDCAQQTFLRRRHVGAGIAESIRMGIAQAMESVKSFSAQWGYAATVNAMKEYGASEPADLFGALLDTEALPTAGVGREGMVDRLVDAWGKEPGYQTTDFVNAITRAAHENSWSSPWTSDELEQAAGKLLAARSWAGVSGAIEEARKGA